MNDTLFPTIIFSNGASDTKLADIKNKILQVAEKISYVHNYEGPTFGKLTANRFKWEISDHIELTNEVLSLLPVEATENMVIDIAFYLQSFYPFQVHNDYQWITVDDDETPFYVVVIPLETVDACTIVLNQIGKNVHFEHYKENNPQLEKKDQLSDEDFEKYFSHCWPHEQPYISIKDIFKWDAGKSLLIDARYFHASDDYKKNNLHEKNCIVLMTKIKKMDYDQTLNKLNNMPL
jgi:hypothetical protein